VTGAMQREVPEAEISILQERGHKYALVIPVINEGERIRQQLTKIFESRPSADVIVADGGSTDGSLAVDFLRATGCRALLVKKGPGRLSAQLRMAYAWALDQGYLGIITIDGNGKDGVAAIDGFIDKLDAGFDYIQGSRYVAGGQAINTPLDRQIAGRLIHAPLLSLSAGRWYSDTTNGFRAYSARYLLDPKVAPFRNVFERYSLLFYLTVRASQLGYRTTEIPVARAYPKDEKTPTKISGLRGRIDMMKELIAVALGRFNPR
jgi:dolichol-phosphate mannosyltransferase